jgi:hypothetical protein
MTNPINKVLRRYKIIGDTIQFRQLSLITGILVLYCVLTSLTLKAQTLGKFEIIKADSTFSIDSTLWKYHPENLTFGGISGLERLPTGDLLLISDRQAPSAKPEDQVSWGFILDSTRNIHRTFPFFGVQNAEAVRWDNKERRLWYSFENDTSTGIGYIDSLGFPQGMAEHSMITSPFTTLNRGVEGLALGEDALWYSFEAGLDSNVFIQWPNKDKTKAKVFTYPLDKKSCLNPKQMDGSSLGNGVSEILDVPGNRDKLLVLERCFNGKYAFIKLFEAEISGNTFTKTELFDWNPSTTFQQKPIKPDNLEGMTWGEDIGGKKTLYLISDDNHNPKHQRTILIKLKEK